MPSNSSNSAVVAAAGSGKTESIIQKALSIPSSERILLTTYTDNGTNEIRRRIRAAAGYIPANIAVMSWFAFLIHHGIRPYQHPTFGVNEVRGLHFEKRLSFPKKQDMRRYYLDPGANVYRDFAAELMLALNTSSGGAVIRRLERIFEHLFFDEIQDASGRDFEVLESLMDSNISVTVVGDPRQGTFSTTQSSTNKKLRRAEIVVWLEGLASRGKLVLSDSNESKRCSPGICQFSDSLYPDLPATCSANTHTTLHDGVVLLRTADIIEYCELYSPQLLVWDARSKTHGMSARNMGDVKGLTFDRVIIQPTGTMEKYLQANAPLAPIAKAKFYVGVTRARQSVAIIMDKAGNSLLEYWSS